MAGRPCTARWAAAGSNLFSSLPGSRTRTIFILRFLAYKKKDSPSCLVSWRLASS